ncbi:hypothetical protein [Neptunicella marina]|uniref:Lipoprotein n=1 Tax=Neptunicella marina TaxID=2125989 RepID=A0A8J6IPV7_9ALTE|nr:hypothetical protein [Neptunicella marina]MBC3764399.1 hypothetical protein [Neptunicella marina]
MLRTISAVVLLVVSGCAVKNQNQGAAETSATGTLAQTQWQQPQKQALLAIEEGDLSLWVVAKKGAQVAYADTTDIKIIDKVCGLKIIPQSGDVYSKQTHQQQKEITRFTRQYNKIVAPYCLAEIAKHK